MFQSATAHMNLGAMYHMNGKLKEAEASYLRALELKPDDVTTQQNLVKLRNLRSKSQQTQHIHLFHVCKKIGHDHQFTMANTLRLLFFLNLSVSHKKRVICSINDEVILHFKSSGYQICYPCFSHGNMCMEIFFPKVS